MYEWENKISATTFSFPIIKAEPPAEAEYSSASPGAPCEVSAPIPIAYFISPALTRLYATNMASVPALHANS